MSYANKNGIGKPLVGKLTPAGSSKRANTVSTRKCPLKRRSGNVTEMLLGVCSGVWLEGFNFDLNEDLQRHDISN